MLLDENGPLFRPVGLRCTERLADPSYAVVEKQRRRAHEVCYLPLFAHEWGVASSDCSTRGCVPGCRYSRRKGSSTLREWLNYLHLRAPPESNTGFSARYATRVRLRCTVPSANEQLFSEFCSRSPHGRGCPLGIGYSTTSGYSSGVRLLDQAGKEI